MGFHFPSSLNSLSIFNLNIKVYTNSDKKTGEIIKILDIREACGLTQAFFK